MLRYASKLTEMPSMVTEEDMGALKEGGWDEEAVWEITALTSFFNFSGRLEAASGLPPDRIPTGARLAEAGGG
jgi:alkylhydroperoxidase family enzyme